MASTEITVVQECSALKWCQRETVAYTVIQIKEGSHINKIIHTYIKEDQPGMPWGNLKDSSCNKNTTIFTEIKSADQNNYILIKKELCDYISISSLRPLLGYSASVLH